MNYFEKKTKEGLKSEQIVSELEETDEYGTPKYHLYILQNETEFKIKKPIKVYYEKQ